MASPISSDNHYSPSYGNRGPLILGISWTEFAIATALVGLRIGYAFSKRISKAGSSLYWTCGSWVFGTIAQAFLTTSAAYGIGNHASILVENGDLTTALMWAWIGQMFVLFAIGLGKVAVVAFLLSVQGPTYKIMRYFIIFLGAANLAIDTACLFEIAFRCRPPRALWDVSAGVCPNSQANLVLGYLTGSWNAASDLTLACYPILLFWNLQVSKMVKIGLCGLLGLGAFAAICSAVKTWQVHVIISTEDPTNDLTDLLIWAWTEMWTVLIAASIAPLWPIFRRYYHQVSTIVKHDTPPSNSIPLDGHRTDHAMRSWKSKALIPGENKNTSLQSGAFTEDTIFMTKDFHLQSELVNGPLVSPYEGSHRGNVVLPNERV